MPSQRRPGPERLNALANLAAFPATLWLNHRRNRYRHTARPLTPAELTALSPFFTQPLLESVRIAHADHIRNPPLARTLRRIGFRGVLDLSTVSGMAFIDTVVIARRAPATLDSAPEPDTPALSLLFHELVHIAQYRALGVRPFVRAYIAGWLAADRDYFSLPLEVQAFELQRRFDREPDAPFSVDDEVRRSLSA